MGNLKLERIGGVGGFGGPHLKSRGEVPFAELSAADRAAVETLFSRKGKTSGTDVNSQVRDGFSYIISRQTASGTETIEVPESLLPAALLSCVKDSLE